MQTFIKHHTGSLIAWIVILLVAVFTLPNTNQLVQDYGQTKIPSSAQSQVADALQNKWGRGQGNTRQVVVVFNNGSHKLTAAQKQSIADTVVRFRQNKTHYHVKNVLAATDNAETKKQLISKDKSTQLLQLMVDKKQTVTAMTKSITKGAKTSGVKTYVTGSDILNQDFTDSTEQGLKKTEVIAAIFIFIVLVLVFRSPVVPVISLLTVGVSVLTSLGIIMNLVKYCGFPLSNFTEVFLVVVLFGIGTDYNILLYDQFKAELAAGLDKFAAARRARQVAGKTILYSGSSLLIGFTALGLAQFSIYRSAVGVAIGVAVLLVVLLTLNPFFMTTLGQKMFWPIKNFEEAKRNKMWHGLATNSVLHPLISLGIVLLVTVPFLITYNNNLNYNTLDELAAGVPAKQGFNVVQKHFSKGTAEPSTLYISHTKKLDQEQYLRILDRVTKKLQADDGVKTVASVTQPGGTAISKLYVGDQVGTVTTGMGTARKGLSKISGGLDDANKQLGATDMTSGLTGVKTMITGTDKLIAGSQQLQTGSTKLSSGATTLATGLNTYTGGVAQLNTALGQLSANSSTINSGVSQLVSSSSNLPLAVAAMAAYNNGISSGVNQINASLNANAADLAKLSAAQAQIEALSSQVTAMKAQMTQLDAMKPELQQLSGYLQKVAALQNASGTSALTATATKIATNEATIVAAAQSIIADTTATDASKAAAQKILTAAKTNQATTTVLTTTVGSLIKNLDVSKVQTQLSGAITMIDSADALLAKADSLSAMGSQLGQLDSSISSLTTALGQLQTATTKAAATANQLNSGVNGSGVDTTSETTIKSTIGNSTLLTSLNKLATGMGQYTAGVDKVATGAGTLNGSNATVLSGANALATGAGTLSTSIPSLTNGLQSEKTGQQTMYTTLSGMVGQVQTLQTGLKSASTGIKQVNTGVQTANTYLTGLQKSAAAKEFYIPKANLEGKTFGESIKQYMSANRKITKMTIVLDSDPSSAKSMELVNKMQKQVQNELKGTPLAGAKVAIGGQTASTADTHTIASSDFIRTAVIMLVGILLALMFITRSVLQPFYILGTLLLAYFTSLGLTRFISGLVLGQHELTWNTPFFAFVMLIALGVDYSIFLMMKYREFGADDAGLSASNRIVKASGIIGTVVLSAAIILSGTFAALMPSGVLTLIQVALAVIIGLIVLVVILPMTQSSLIHLTYDAGKKQSKH